MLVKVSPPTVRVGVALEGLRVEYSNLSAGAVNSWIRVSDSVIVDEMSIIGLISSASELSEPEVVIQIGVDFCWAESLRWALSTFFCVAMFCLFVTVTTDVLLSRWQISAWQASHDKAKIQRFKCLWGMPSASRLRSNIRLLGCQCARWRVTISFLRRHIFSKRCCTRPSMRPIKRKVGTYTSLLGTKSSGRNEKLLHVGTLAVMVMSESLLSDMCEEVKDLGTKGTETAGEPLWANAKCGLHIPWQSQLNRQEMWHCRHTVETV